MTIQLFQHHVLNNLFFPIAKFLYVLRSASYILYPLILKRSCKTSIVTDEATWGRENLHLRARKTQQQ